MITTVHLGTAGICQACLWDFVKLFSTGLAIQWPIRLSEFIASYMKTFYVLAQGSALRLSTKFNVQIEAGWHVSHPSNMKMGLV